MIDLHMHSCKSKQRSGRSRRENGIIIPSGNRVM